ncbi:MAG: glycosyltransferase family 1 protein [Chloroflexaceae bacterium]|nr:glycosyltransferase family 1 protein [Chloroflexaceae bacterium]NJL34125.1 glycosyltransferase family 1 protein [Chloroflexaceae bacterium]NJO06155.1 glycosyltransferase family 1 protein [Chloroflexaceae bacterium]
MRVALICETFLPNVNGVVTTLCRILEYLQAEGYPALLFAPRGAPDTYAGAEIVPLHGVTFPPYPEIRVTLPQPGVSAHLQRFRPDIVHLVGPVIYGALAPAVVEGLRLPIISSYHTDFGAYTRHYGMGGLHGLVNFYLRWMHNRTRITLCPSTATLNSLRAQGFRRLKVWGRGVDTERFHPMHRSEAWRAAMGVRPGETLLVYVGRLAKEKRVDLLPEALRGLDNVRMVLVGDGPARIELQQQMQGMPVRFVGYLKGQELATAYASSDVFVFPSDTDTFGQVIQEAMASGLAVVGARSGGTLDLVQPHVTGCMFVPGVATDLRTQLRYLVNNPDHRAAIGQAGRAAAERRSWPSVIAELMGYYRHVVRRSPRSTRV